MYWAGAGARAGGTAPLSESDPDGDKDSDQISSSASLAFDSQSVLRNLTPTMTKALIENYLQTPQHLNQNRHWNYFRCQHPHYHSY
jgi:hypothetical protein